jgi:hypothetical protein
MDILLFWVTLGFQVEMTRKVIVKACSSMPKKDPNSLQETLLKPEEVLDEFGNCKLGCCANTWEKKLEELYNYKTSSKNKLVSGSSWKSWKLGNVVTTASELNFKNPKIEPAPIVA